MKTMLLLFLFFFLSCNDMRQANQTVEEKPNILVANTCGSRGCSGDDYCSACKNCSGCKHCAKQGGTCGVCQPPKKGKKK